MSINPRYYSLTKPEYDALNDAGQITRPLTDGPISRRTGPLPEHDGEPLLDETETAALTELVAQRIQLAADPLPRKPNP
jgi:hypothetical protein